MKGIVIKPNGEQEVRDFEQPLYKTVGKAVGGYIEIVRPIELPRPYCIVCNEEGLLMHLDINIIGTRLYGLPLVGTIVIMKEGMTDEGPDIVGLDEKELEQVMSFTKYISQEENK